MQINRISNTPIQRKQAPQASFKGRTYAHFSLPAAKHTSEQSLFDDFYRIHDDLLPPLMQSNGAKMTLETVFNAGRIHKLAILDFPKGTEKQEITALAHLYKLAADYPERSRIIAEPQINLTEMIEDIKNIHQN